MELSPLGAGWEGYVMGASPGARVEGRIEMGKLRAQLQQEGIRLDSREHYHRDGDLLQEVSKEGFRILPWGSLKA